MEREEGGRSKRTRSVGELVRELRQIVAESGVGEVSRAPPAPPSLVTIPTTSIPTTSITTTPVCRCVSSWPKLTAPLPEAPPEAPPLPEALPPPPPPEAPPPALAGGQASHLARCPPAR